MKLFIELYSDIKLLKKKIEKNNVKVIDIVIILLINNIFVLYLPISITHATDNTFI